MTIKFRDTKVCIVTGAGNGLGAAMAHGLANAGACVVLADIDQASLQKTAASIAAKVEAHVTAVVADMTQEEQVKNVVDVCLNTFGGLDVVINNAGTGAQIVRPNFLTQPLMSWDVPADKWRKIMDVNAIGPFLLSRLAIPHMLHSGWGRIVNVSTTWETMLRPGFASYGPSKAALESMSVGMSRELEGTGVTVNTVIPGGPADTAQVPSDIGVDRAKLLRPEVMVPTIVWLASNASDGVTGRRFTAADWDPSRPDAENLEKATEPAAWPQLVKTIVMQERGNLS